MYRNPLFLLSGVPTGSRTPVTGVKGPCPRPLDDGDALEDERAGLYRSRALYPVVGQDVKKQFKLFQNILLEDHGFPQNCLPRLQCKIRHFRMRLPE